MSLNISRQQKRKSLIVQLKAYLAEDSNLWRRMASSHPDAQGVNERFLILAKHLRACGITASTVENYINAAPLDLLCSFEDE